LTNPPEGANASYCSSCATNVVDFSNNNIPDQKAHCGTFNLGQVSSFVRDFSFTNAAVYSVSLLSFLGMTISPKIMSAQKMDVKPIVKSKGELKIKGRLVLKGDKEFRNWKGVLEVYSKQKLVGVTSVKPGGWFDLAIDTIENPIEDLKVTFSNYWYQSDVVELSRKVLSKEFVTVKMKVEYDAPTTPKITINGNYEESILPTEENNKKELKPYKP